MTQTVFCVGHAVNDLVFSLPALPNAAQKYRANGFDTVGGGPAASAAVAVARLNGRALLATRLGDDPTGDEIIGDLEREGVDCSAARRFQGRRSALSAVIIDARGERMIVNHTDPDLSRDPDWIAAAMPSDVSAVLADITWPEGAHAALIEARRRGAPGILDADHPIPGARDVFKAASHLAFSAQGMRAYAGGDDLATAVRDAARETGAWCCVTDGARGVLVASPGSDAVSQVSGFDVDAVDTLGAGDVWHGAFALRLAETRDESDAVRFANAAAAIKVTRPGGRRGAPNRAETDAFLETRSAGDTFTSQSRSA